MIYIDGCVAINGILIISDDFDYVPSSFWFIIIFHYKFIMIEYFS
jgi:hypothetical protein